MEPDDKSITINLNDYVSGDITIDLNNTYGATTTYLSDDITISDGTYTITTGASDWITSDTIDISSILNGDLGGTYHEEEIERMSKEYPGLEKAWRNFKSVYDMVKQDYEGKKRAGELDE